MINSETCLETSMFSTNFSPTFDSKNLPAFRIEAACQAVEAHDRG